MALPVIRVMRLRTLPATLLMTAALSGVPPSLLAAQGPPRGTVQTQSAPATRPETFVDRQSAHETRSRLHELLSNFPPALTQVLRLDPSLISNADYLAPYPGLATFLQQHPDVARNPSFYLGEIRFASESTHREQTINALEEILAGIGFFIFFMAALAIFSSASRSLLDHRRWLHAVKVQTEAHTKLVDRLASNEDLMAYVQSSAGQRFLSATSLTAEP